MAVRDSLVKSFVQKTGLRAGQRYTVKRGASGLPVRVYASGDTALAKGAFPGKSGVERQQLARRKRSMAQGDIAAARKLSGY